MAAVAIVVAAISSGLVLPLSLLGLIASVGFLGLVVVSAGGAPLRNAVTTNAIRRARRDRRDARERALAPASFGRVTLSELTMLVDEIEARDPELANRLDLESLLDRHVGLTLAHDRALRAVAMTDRGQLERIRDSYRQDPEASRRRLDLCERRLKCLDRCEAKAEELADELAILADLIRLIAQRVACPDEPVPDEAIDRQLLDLDEDDAARCQLAEFH